MTQPSLDEIRREVRGVVPEPFVDPIPGGLVVTVIIVFAIGAYRLFVEGHEESFHPASFFIGAPIGVITYLSLKRQADAHWREVMRRYDAARGKEKGGQF